MGNKKILVIGSSNTDMTIKGEKLPAPGETIIGGTFHMGPGGKGANQAVAAQRLGGDVTFICKVGRDIFGENAITGRLPFQIPASMDQVLNQREDLPKDIENPLFEYGFGIETEAFGR